MKVFWFAAALLTALPLQAADPDDAAQRIAKLESLNPPELAVMDPLQFLAFLQKRGPEGGAVTIWNPKRGWIQAAHIPRLIALLDSKRPCAPVVDSHSSFSPPGSTIGAEAALMIASFRDGAYPSALSAGHHRVGTRAELLAWWVEQNSNGVAAPIASGQRSP